jgi:hypothetical protein
MEYELIIINKVPQNLRITKGTKTTVIQLDSEKYAELAADPDVTFVNTHIVTQSVDELRMAAYGTWQEQMDMQYHGTWKAHVAKVKKDNPKD